MFCRFPKRVAPASLAEQFKQVVDEKKALVRELAAIKAECAKFKQSRLEAINLLKTEHDQRLSETSHLTAINLHLGRELAALQERNKCLAAERDALDALNVRLLDTVETLKAGVCKISACLVCPITQHIVEDPVIASDGHLYGRAPIREWIARSVGFARSPMTNQALPYIYVVQCVVVRQILDILAGMV